MSTVKRLTLLGAVAGLAVTAWLLRPGSAPPAAPENRLSLRRAMAPGDTAGFARALEPRPFTFPADHGPHPEFQVEWWYFTGNLSAAEPASSATTEPGVPDGGDRFGYQLTFFRSALRPPASAATDGASSAWSADQIYMAHLGLTDGAAERFHSFERFARGAVGLAGARARPLRVWLEDWSAEAVGDDGPFPLTLRASEAGVGLELTLEAEKPLVLQGDAGLSRKGPTPGNASYYYSYTRLRTRGRLELPGRTVEVRGTSWLDREWSTSALEPDVVGWDWFALQLSDGRELMFYRLRRADGSGSPFSSGTVVDPDGGRTRLELGDVELAERSTWASPATGAVYPSGWSLSSELAGVDLVIEPLVRAQEHTSSVVYWEGAVGVTGSSGGREVRGVGFVELTGYELRDG